MASLRKRNEGKAKQGRNREDLNQLMHKIDIGTSRPIRGEKKPETQVPDVDRVP